MCCSWAEAVKSQGCIIRFSFKNKITKLVCNMLCLIKAYLTLSQRNTIVAKHTHTDTMCIISPAIPCGAMKRQLMAIQSFSAPKRPGRGDGL